MSKFENIVFANENLKIIQHSNCAHGFFYYIEWARHFFDEFGYPHNDDLKFFYIVDDFGDLVPCDPFDYVTAYCQEDGDFMSYYGFNIGRKLCDINLSWLVENVEEYGMPVIMGFRKVGRIIGYSENFFTQELLFEFVWEDGSKSEFPHNQFAMEQIYALA